MEVVIIEDEDLAAESLENLLLKIRNDIVIKKHLDSVKHAMEWLKTNTCDLIFSDIHLGDGESFEIFEALNTDTPIIFTTAYDQYAIQAFQFYAIDYLLKPYSKEKLNRALNKYSNYTDVKHNNYSEIESLISRLKTLPETNYSQSRFLVSKGEELVSINSEEIAYFMAEDKSLFLFTKNREIFLYDDTLSKLEQKLSSKDFFKVNRKFIVRHNSVKSIIKYSQNRLKINLQPSPTSRDHVLISSKRIQSFKDWLNK